jgi:hypothetical protein
MTIEVPQDLAHLVERIPNIQSRIIVFLRHQASLEQWRKGRYSSAAQEIATASKMEAEKMIADEVTRDQAVSMFQEVHGRITNQL